MWWVIRTRHGTSHMNSYHVMHSCVTCRASFVRDMTSLEEKLVTRSMTWRDVMCDVTWLICVRCASICLVARGDARHAVCGMMWRDVTWRDVTWRDVTWRDVTWRDSYTCNKTHSYVIQLINMYVTWPSFICDVTPLYVRHRDMTHSWRDLSELHVTRFLIFRDIVWRDVTLNI